MPRRSPPTPLRLYNGPLPPRGIPRHTLPSLPRPVFHGTVSAPSAGGPVPRARMANTDLPAIVIPDGSVPAVSSSSAIGAMAMSLEGNWSGPSSPTSAESMASVGSGAKKTRSSKEFVRGPWDHSGAIHVPFDVEAVLPAPMPAAINTRSG